MIYRIHITELTLSHMFSKLMSEHLGSLTLRDARPENEKWPLNSIARVSAPSIRANAKNLPSHSTGCMIRPKWALGNLGERFLPNLKPGLGNPNGESFESGGAIWNAS